MLSCYKDEDSIQASSWQQENMQKTGFWQRPDAEPCVFTVIRARKNPEACVFTVILETQVQPYHTLKGSRSLLPSLFKACGNPDATLSHFEGVEATFA